MKISRISHLSARDDLYPSETAFRLLKSPFPARTPRNLMTIPPGMLIKFQKLLARKSSALKTEKQFLMGISPRSGARRKVDTTSENRRRKSFLVPRSQQDRELCSRTSWLVRDACGFTVVEMLVATAVFSMVLMVVSIGLLQISRTFYKGVTVTNTQEVARSIIDEVAASIAFSASDVQPLASPGTSEGYCVGNIRYSFRPGEMLIDDSSSHAFVTDRLDKLSPPLQCASSVQAHALPAGPLTNGERELISPRMRISNFSITPMGNRLYRVSLRLVSGEDDLLNSPAAANASCAGFRSGSQFCATVELTTVVQKRLQ